MRFEGKAGLVTGAGSGIGRATAKGFAQRGGAVAIADINGDNANRVAAEITAAGGKAIAIVADVTKDADLEMMISRTTREFGRLDFLHNNAFGFAAMPGVSAVAATADTDDRMWNATLEVGLTAVFRAIKLAVPVMRAQGSGAIVNTASISGLFADYGIVAYNAAKAGVINLTRVAATECQPGENANEVAIARFFPLQVKRRGVELRLVIEGNGASAPRADQALLKAVARPRRWFDDLVSGRAQSIAEIAQREGITGRYVRRMLRLAFLAPEIVEAIAQGRQPPDLTTEALTQRIDLPLVWTSQKAALAVQ